MSRPPRKICRKCRCPLNAWEDSEDGSVRYRHGAVDCGEDDPIDPDGGVVEYHCDFCLTPGPVWTFPCGQVTNPAMAFVDAFATRDYISPDDWAACADCVPLVEAKDWRALWGRNRHLREIRESTPEHFHAARLTVLRLWLEFDRQRTGPPYLDLEPDEADPQERSTSDTG